MYFENLCSLLKELPQVQALALGGSRASLVYDNKSDYDLYVYVSSVPENDLRKKILDECCSYIEMGNSFWELEDDCTLKDGIDIDILYRNMESFSDEVKSVVEEHYAHNGYTTCMWHNLLHSKIIFDRNGDFERMQKRYSVPYPLELQNNIIKRNMSLLSGMLPSYDLQIKKAVLRDDKVSICHRTAAFMESYFDIIFAMNKLTHPGEKRMVQYAVKNALVLPADFEHNLNTLYSHLFNQSSLVNEDIKRIINELKKTVYF